MKIDVTTIFFNSIIDGGTATAPWCVSIGQGKDKKINNDILGLNDVLDGLIYKSVSNRDWVDTSAGSKNNEYLLISKFDKIFINGVQQESLNLIGLLVREHTKSHEGRLRISFPPYASYNDGEYEFTNQDSYQAISEILGCGKIDGSGGCWFVDDISVLNQDELHLSCIVVDPNGPKIYKTSQNRSCEWQSLSSDRPDYEITRLPYTLEEPLNDEALQIIFYGAPGTGKSHKIDNDPHVTDENTIRTTFHPDSDYSTFVGAYKPTMAPMPVNAFVGTTIHHAKNADDEKAYEKKIVYKYVPQAFLKVYVAAWSDLDNPHFLVIEEINRGNCAQIFGDLFQLLDRNNAGSSSYAIHADEDITQFLAEDKNGFANLSEEQKDAIRSFVLIKDYGKTEAIGDAILSGKKLLLPPNLYIWATMNTSDQSLFPIDSAFKRRWNWEYMPIDYNAMDWQFEVGGKRYLWSDFLKKMNPLVYNLTQSSDKQMGYFFAKADKKTDDAQPENNLISEKIFLNKVLFYIWTDVLKDFETGDKIFRDEEKGHMYQFSDFFPTTNGKLAEFVGKLELPVIGDSVSDNSSVDDEDDTSGNNTKSSKDQSRYSVNGVGTLKKGPAAVEALRLYVQNNPDATAADIVSAWKIPGFPLVESEESFASRLAKSNDDRLEKRTELINLANGESIRIFKGFNPQSMQDFINALDKQDWNIIIRKV